MALTSSTTEGCNIVLTGLGLGPGDEVVTTDSEHFGLLLPLHVSGARVRVAQVAATPGGGRAADDPSEHRPADEADRAVAGPLDHRAGAAGARAERESGMPVLVDGAQSVGAIPVDVGGRGLLHRVVPEVAVRSGADRRASGARPGTARHRHAELFLAEVARAGRDLRADRRRRAVRFAAGWPRRASRASRPHSPCARVAFRARRRDGGGLSRRTA